MRRQIPEIRLAWWYPLLMCLIRMWYIALIVVRAVTSETAWLTAAVLVRATCRRAVRYCMVPRR